MPLIERDITLTCVSNEVGGPYVSTGRWLGVPFAEIIRRVGVQAGRGPGVLLLLRLGLHLLDAVRGGQRRPGRDGRGRPERRGAARPRGFPARMLVPGLFGFVSATKWLERIEFTTYAERTRVLDRPGLGHRCADPDPEPDRAAEVAGHPAQGQAGDRRRGLGPAPRHRQGGGPHRRGRVAGSHPGRRRRHRPVAAVVVPLRRSGRPAQRPGPGHRPDRRRSSPSSGPRSSRAARPAGTRSSSPPSRPAGVGRLGSTEFPRIPTLQSAYRATCR